MAPGKKPPTATAASAEGKDGKAPVKGYKPPWIKESAEPNKETETPWGIMKKRDCINDPEEAKKAAATQKLKSRGRDDDEEEDAGANFAIPTLRKVSLKTEKIENGDAAEPKEPTFAKPPLKSVRTKEPKPLTREESKSKIVIPKLNSVKVEKMKELPPPPKKDKADYRNVLKKAPTLDRIDDEKKRGAPMAPPMPPMPPPPPAMPKLIDNSLNDKQKAVLDTLKSRPKTRPDWTALLKGIETGAKLKHVEINDRSKPVLPKAKAKGQFLYESEKDNAHNVLLKEIQQGTRLKAVKTNDRSKPNLEGLRKFRRQMTIEEQIQKSVSMASMAGMPINLQNNPSMASIVTNLQNNPSMANMFTNLQNNASMASIVPPDDLAADLDDLDDELDDIDKVRDDLQSTKQLLAIEMRNKEQQIRENKRLQSRIQNLEKDLDENKSIAKNEKEHDKRREPDEKLIVTLKAEAAEARKRNEELEKKLTQTAKELDNTKYDLEEMKRRNSELEKRLQEYMTGKRYSVADRRESQMLGDEDGDRDDDEDDEEDEESEEKAAKRGARELKMLVNKLRGFKNKVDNAKKERIALKEIMKKHQGAIRDEKKRFKQLQKEVDKMAALMKESESDEEDSDEEDHDEEDSEDETTESETESSDTESESERSQSESEDAPLEKKKENVVARSRRHENRLSALKKTNFMLKTNAERLQDDLNQQKETTATLQNDLDSVLAELG